MAFADEELLESPSSTVFASWSDDGGDGDLTAAVPDDDDADDDDDSPSADEVTVAAEDDVSSSTPASPQLSKYKSISDSKRSSSTSTSLRT